MGIQPIRKQVSPEIPDKLYFRIGDVARLCEVPAYVLRFWETEFPQLKPNKGGTGQRLYRKRDVEMALRIKSLLYDQGYTIPGARQVFKNELKPREASAPEPSSATDVATEAAPTTLAPLADAHLSAGTTDADAGEHLRRHAKLRALQIELQALLTSLDKPAGEFVSAQSPRPQALRPRLVAESKAEAKLAPARAERLRLVLEPADTRGLRDPRDQGDLFSAE